MENIKKEFLSVQELSEYTGFKVSYIYHLTHNKKIPFKRPNGKLVFSKNDIDEWLNNSSVEIDNK